MGRGRALRVSANVPDKRYPTYRSLDLDLTVFKRRAEYARTAGNETK